MANTAIVQGLITFIVSFIDVYGKYLLAKERIEVIRNAFEKYRAYMLEYFCNWMKENGTDASDMEKFIKSVEFPDRDGSESL